MSQAHPFTIFMNLGVTIVCMILIAIGVVAEKLASVQEQTVDFEGLVDSIVALHEIHAALLRSFVENRTGSFRKQSCMNREQIPLKPNEDEEHMGLEAGQDVRRWSNGTEDSRAGRYLGARE